MSDHDHVEPLLAPHALGTLEAAERARVDAHLLECAACRVLFDELTAAVATVECAILADVQVPVAARADLIARARTTPQHQAAEAAAAARVPTRARRLRPGWSGLAAAALAAACTVLLIQMAHRDDQIDQLQGKLREARGDQVAVLKGATVGNLDVDGPFGDARGQVVLQRDSGVVVFRQVPQPPAGMVWQVWTVSEDDHIESVGVIDGQREAAFLPLSERVDPDDVDRIIVTVEPAGGSNEPTAEEVAEATI